MNASMNRSLAGGPFRFAVPLVLGLLVLVAVFWLLSTLIAYNGSAVTDLKSLPTINFTQVKKNLTIETKEHKPPQMPNKVATPPQVQTQTQQVQGPQGNSVNIGPMTVNNDIAQNTGFALSSSDGDYLPIVKVAPLYPERAAEQGIEGYVELSFTVTETGSVTDPVVIEAQPKGVFDDAAKRAVLRFKYKPRVEDGKPVRVSGVKQVITFKLDKNGRQ